MTDDPRTWQERAIDFLNELPERQAEIVTMGGICDPVIMGYDGQPIFADGARAMRDALPRFEVSRGSVCFDPQYVPPAPQKCQWDEYCYDMDDDEPEPLCTNLAPTETVLGPAHGYENERDTLHVCLGHARVIAARRLAYAKAEVDRLTQSTNQQGA